MGGKKKRRKKLLGEARGNVPGLFVDAVFDETSKPDAARVRAFLKDYKMLCKKHGCLVLSDGEDVEVCPSVQLAGEKDPWGVEEITRSRGWKL